MDESAISPKLRELALDLRNSVPRSPREVLGGYVILARALDRCRAYILGQNGEYVYNRMMDMLLFEFLNFEADAFKAAVAEGRTDEEMLEWIKENAREHSMGEIIAWNNKMRNLTVGDLPVRVQIYMETYIPKHIPAGRVVYRWFDVYDIEEGRI